LLPGWTSPKDGLRCRAKRREHDLAAARIEALAIDGSLSSSMIASIIDTSNSAPIAEFAIAHPGA